MKAKKYLSEYVRARQEIKSLEEIQQGLRERAEKISGDMTTERVQSSKLNDQMAELIAKIVDNVQEIVRMEVEAYKVQVDIIKTIGKIEDSPVRLVLNLRYLGVGSDGRLMRWDEVADRSSYSLSEVYKLHRRGLEEVDRIINTVRFYADGREYFSYEVKDDSSV